jgi:hypothetical protein
MVFLVSHPGNVLFNFTSFMTKFKVLVLCFIYLRDNSILWLEIHRCGKAQMKNLGFTYFLDEHLQMINFCEDYCIIGTN